MADTPMKIVRDALKHASPALAKKNWREALRDETGQDGNKIWKKIAALADGRAIQVQLDDGRMSIPVLPSPDVQLRANMFIAEMGFGRAVPQTEIVKAEMEAKDFEAVRALSEEELDRQIALLEANVPIDAAFVVEPDVQELDIWTQIYYSRCSEEQDP